MPCRGQTVRRSQDRPPSSTPSSRSRLQKVRSWADEVDSYLSTLDNDRHPRIARSCPEPLGGDLVAAKLTPPTHGGIVSFLHNARLVFSGRFQADVSTVN